MPQLIVIYGPPLSGKSSLARAVAESLDSKAAIVSTDNILDEAILVHDENTYAELEVVHTQARLLVANFLKNRYNVVLEGAFSYERNGNLHHHEQEIDQTVSLMRNLADAPLLVRLTATLETLHERAANSLRLRDADAALRIAALYRQRDGSRALSLPTDDMTVEALAAEVRGHLL